MSDHRPTQQCPCGCDRPSPHDICTSDYERWPCTTARAQIPIRERIVQALYEPPDARTRADAVMPIVEELATDLDHAERALRRLVDQIRALHSPEQSGPHHTLSCRSCRTAVWPCPTRAAID